MILEDRGVPRDNFLSMQNDAKATVILSEREIERFRDMLRDQGLGGPFRLAYITDKLRQLDFEMAGTPSGRPVDLTFYNRLVKYATHHVLRDIKHGARM
jgi:RNA-dependent RNA polymerase